MIKFSEETNSFIVDPYEESDSYESARKFLIELSKRILEKIRNKLIEKTWNLESKISLFFHLHCNSRFEFGILGKSFKKLTRKLFKETWIELDRKILQVFGGKSQNTENKALHITYTSCNGIFLQDWLKEMYSNEFEFIEFQTHQYPLERSRIPKSLIYWIFESQRKPIGECVRLLYEEYRRFKEEIWLDYTQEYERITTKSKTYLRFSEVFSIEFLSKNVTLSHSFFGNFFLHLVLRYDKTPDFHNLHHSEFIIPEENYYNTTLKKESDFPLGVYCFNIDGDGYIVHYKDKNLRNRVVVVDGGRHHNESFSTFWNFLSSKVSVIDLYLLTHRDEDHVGAFVMFLKGYKKYVIDKKICKNNREEKSSCVEYYPIVKSIIYRRKLLEGEMNQVLEFSEDETLIDYYRERYRYLSVSSAIKDVEEYIKIIDPDTNICDHERYLQDLCIELLPRETHMNGKRVWERIHNVTGENYYSLSLILTHHENNEQLLRCIFSGDVREDTIMEKLSSISTPSSSSTSSSTEEEKFDFFFADLPMHGSKNCCSEGKFLSLNVKHFVCTRNKKTPSKDILDCLTRKPGFVFLTGLGREIVFDNKTCNTFGDIVHDVGTPTTIGKVFLIRF